MNKWILILMIILIGSGCASKTVQENVYEQTNNDEQVVIESEEEAIYTKITAEEAKALMSDDVIVLDVRTKDEYDQGHIENAILLPVDDVIAGNTEVLEDQNQTILVYCRSGNRSATAAKALIEAGYTEVFDFGGINDWPYDTVQ